MVGRQVAMAVLGVCLLHAGALALLAVFGDGGSYWAVWAQEPGVMLFGTAVAFLAMMAAVISPELRRDTRASASAFRSGVVYVWIDDTQPPWVRGELPVPRRRALPGEVPGVVPGEVVEPGTAHDERKGL